MQLMLMNEKSVDLGSGQTATVRTLMLQNHAEPFSSLREIIQLHYEGWPDFGTPAEAKTIVQLVCVLSDLANPKGSPTPRGTLRNAPVVVHCSAGCGRTGTFCTVDSIIDHLSVRMIEREDEEDLVFRSVSEMREQRMSLVQTLRQYVLCYDCILWYLVNTMGLEEEEEQGEEMLVDGLAD
jgi:protein tyrosine phosphatase